ncbi:MAG: NAD-dependent epimerase/dehydratase family protein [Ilumatobacteraceae bacterium]
MNRVMITGGTGLVGSNIVSLLGGEGVEVVALVRNGADASALELYGATIVRGDVTDRGDIERASDGCDGIIHSAAVLGGANEDPTEMRAVNVGGGTLVLDVAAQLEIRALMVSSVVVFDRDGSSLDERTPLVVDAPDPYTLSKLEILSECEARAHAGQDVVTVMPGSIYGPGEPVARAMGRTSFNRAIRAAINGRIDQYLDLASPWVYALDVARTCIAAYHRGQPLTRYLAFGAEGLVGGVRWLNAACEAAGVEHRITALQLDAADPDTLAAYGPSVLSRLEHDVAPPTVDASFTWASLDARPHPLEEAMAATVTWMRANGQIGTT